MYLRSPSRYQRNFNGYTFFSGSSIPLGLMELLWDQTGNGKIQDGDLSTSIACLCALGQDIKGIPTAIPTFLWSSIPLELVEWCATKPEVEGTECYTNARLFDLFPDIDTHMITKVLINKQDGFYAFLKFRNCQFFTSGLGGYRAPKPEVEKIIFSELQIRTVACWSKL